MCAFLKYLVMRANEIHARKFFDDISCIQGVPKIVIDKKFNSDLPITLIRNVLISLYPVDL